MALLLPLMLIQLAAAEPFIYLHPVNPKLHPKEMYPIQSSVRGFQKVRDLPPSGIVYLHRIKPMGDFGRAVAQANNTLVIDESAVPLTEFTPSLTESARRGKSQELTSQNTQSPVSIQSNNIPAPAIDSDAELTSPPSSATTEGTTTTTTTTEPHSTTTSTAATASVDLVKFLHIGSSSPKRSGLKIAMAKTVKTPKEFHPVDEGVLTVEEVIARLKEEAKQVQEMEKIARNPKVATINMPKEMIERNPQVPTIDMPKNQFRSQNALHHKSAPRMVPLLSRSAQIHEGESLRSQPMKRKLISLTKRKTYATTRGDARRKGAEFDPWERMGQKV